MLDQNDSVINKFIQSSKYSFMNEICGNIIDSIENEAYKIQQYIDVITKEMPKICDHELIVEKKLNNTIRFFVTEHENIICSKCLTFITDVDAFVEDKFNYIEYHIKDANQKNRYKLSKSRIRDFMDYMTKAMKEAETGAMFVNTKIGLRSIDFKSYLAGKIANLRTFDTVNIDLEEVDNESASILFTEAYTEMHKLSYKYKKSIYPKMPLCDALVLTQLCFDLIVECLYFLKTVEVIS